MANGANLRICLAITIFFLAIAGLAQGATITVGPGDAYDFDTIQAGIDAANGGDTVLAAPGEYIITEPVTFRGKAITVKSEAGSDETTIRMGTPADTNRGSVVVFESSETAASVLDGFTVTGGSGSWLPSHNTWVGGGIYFDASSGTVRNCTTVQNRAEYGGGVFCAQLCSPILTDCIIMENSSGEFGGGVMVYSGSSMTLTNCIIKGNSATEGGAGVCCSFDSIVTMNNCMITGNRATRDLGGAVNCGQSASVNMNDCVVSGNSSEENSGGGVACWQGSVTMVRCAIMNNSGQKLGGGVYVGHGSATVTNCVIAQNTAGWGGGGVCSSYADASIAVSNCTIWGNSGGVEGGGGGVLSRVGSTMIMNSIVCGNTSTKGPEISLITGGTLGIAYSNIAGGQTGVSVEGGCALNWGAGNIDADPCFANLGYWADINDPNIFVEPDDPNAVWIDGDYHLKSEAGRWAPNSQSWIQDDVTSPCIDAGDPNSDWGAELWPHGERINMGAYGGTSQASMSLSDAGAVVYIQWLGHSTVKVWTEDCIVYVDPERVPESLHDATLVCVTHTHGDHYSPADIARVSNSQTQFIGPPDVVQQYGSGQAIAPGQTIEFDCTSVTGVASYNTNKPNHPKSRNWVGFIIELGSKRIYVAGDTDLTDEMRALEDIDVAILPAGGTYTMDAVEAAEATQYLRPELAIPYHWGQNVGTLSDAQTFAELARCAVKILTVGETISSDNWPEYSPLIAHWKLDETEGSIAHDSADDNDGTLQGEPLWQPTEGKMDGALQFNGIYDYVSTPFVLNPADGAFSVFAWISGVQPVQSFANVAIISQMDGTGTGATWLGAISSDGKLMTGLVPPPVGRFVPILLVSEYVITDGQWHHVGLVWDGSRRYLYVDAAEVAKDTKAQAPLKSSDGGLYFGAGKTLDAASFFIGLIDDIRIYNQPLSPEEIETLAR